MSAVVYRIYDDDDVLLYIGCTESLKARMYQHRKYRPWADRIARVEHHAFAYRMDAQDAERAMIQEHQPPFNIQYTERDPARLTWAERGTSRSDPKWARPS